MKVVFIKSHFMQASKFEWATLLRKYRRKEFMTADELKEFDRLVNTCPVKMRQLRLWKDPKEFVKACQLYDSINTEKLWAKMVAAHPYILTLNKRPSQSPPSLRRLWLWLWRVLRMIYRRF